MTYTEKSLQCSDCGKPFPFTTEEQEFFATKGFTNEPKRCFPCRSARRAEKFGNDSGSSNRWLAPDVSCHLRTLRQADRSAVSASWR